MAKHIVFLVHGVGDTQPGWSLPSQELLRTAYSGYQISNLMPFDQFFTFKEIFWDDLFDERRTAWKNAADEVISALGDAGIGKRAVNRLTKWASEPDKDNFFTTSALDVVMYRFFSTVAEQVRTSIEKQILNTLLDSPPGDTPKWSIIAHSLGTSMTHDVLHQMFSPHRVAAGFPPLPAGTIRPHVLMMVANVSRLLENKDFFGPEGDVFLSATRPSADVTAGACDFFINVRHEFDPIPKPRLFRPTDDWPDIHTRAEGRYIDVLINAIENRHVHDLTHYLRNPKTHVPLFRLLTVPGLLPDEEARNASMRFEAATPLAQFETEAKRLSELALAESENDWKKILDMVRTYLQEFAT